MKAASLEKLPRYVNSLSGLPFVFYFEKIYFIAAMPEKTDVSSGFTHISLIAMPISLLSRCQTECAKL